MKPPRILVVDDDEESRRALAAVLSPACRIVEASNGREALGLLRDEKPRLMLLDLGLPGMGGLEVLARVRRIAPDIPVVMLTADADIGSAVRALNQGACAYFTKPYDPVSLREEIARVLAPAADAGDPPWQVRGLG
ncbi:MAG TPA: response regulator [Elusimicrobiota bacterium]|jgi:CheY-like chemotaxis protein|nr:response regulator [Elusimicrobiota bacterium]